MKVHQTRDDENREDFELRFDGDELEIHTVHGRRFRPLAGTVIIEVNADDLWEDTAIELRGPALDGSGEVREQVLSLHQLPTPVKLWLDDTLEIRNDNR